jgi:hypothetical protein
MQELIDQLKSKAGLTEDQAVKAVHTIKEFIQSKLPPMMHGMVDNFLAQNNNADDDFIDGGGAEDEDDSIGDKINDWKDKAGDAAKDALGKLKSMMNDKDKEL